MICVECGLNKKIHARGLCIACYRKASRKGTLRDTAIIPIPDLPGEKWVEIPTHPCWWLSTAARVKSTRSSKHRLLKPWLLNGVWGIGDKKERGTFLLHTKMVELFLGAESGDIIFLDGDRKNPALSNLVVDTLHLRKGRAIRAAEQSQSRWGQAFADYWRGDRNALDDFYRNMQLYLFKAVTAKLSKWRREYMDVDDIVHSVLVAAFFSISNARMVPLDNVTNYLLTIADRIISTNRRYYSNLIPLDMGAEADGLTVLDTAGYLSPSAELEAIARETTI